MSFTQLPQVLYRYFSLNGSVHIPGLGQLNLCRIPAINDFIGKKILPFSYVIRYDRWEEGIPPEQLAYLQKHAGMDKSQLDEQLEILGFEMKLRLEQEGKIDWQGLGTFMLNENGEIVFHQKMNNTATHADVRYKHVIREKVDHPVVVGEQETTLAEMEEYFEEKPKPSFFSGWRLGAAIITAVIVSALSVRFFMGNFDIFEPMYSPLHLNDPVSTHIILK